MESSAFLTVTQRQTGRVDRAVVERLGALLDRGDILEKGSEFAPPLAHWLAFLPSERQSDLGPDGHAERGAFLPQFDNLTRRMWAGSRTRFLGDLPLDTPLEMCSEIRSVKRKEGRSGPFALVTVLHRVARPDSPALVEDEQDIVYRPAPKTPSSAAGDEAPDPGSPTGDWHRSLTPDPVMLFRYSALTFNGHRIHYDRPYATETEGYPGLVVHGPLTATLLLDLLDRHSRGARLKSFSFTALRPLFDGQRLHLDGTPPDREGKVGLWARDYLGRVAMRAVAELEI